MKISRKPLRTRTAFKSIYDDFVEDKSLFPANYHLLSFALIYGILFSKKSTQPLQYEYVTLNKIADQTILGVFDMAYLILSNQSDDDMDTIWKEMLHIADGGLLELKKIYDQNNDFMLDDLVKKSETNWKQILAKLEI